MTRFVPGLLGILLMFFVFSCQKEASFELGQPSNGSLQSETTGDCLPKTVAGAYVAESALTDSNYIKIDVNVETTGPYTITTDTINGYFFNATGVFGQTGINTVKLKSSGKPIASGTDEFMVFYDSSYCYVPVTVLPAGSNAGPAQFTLQSSSSACSNITLDGDFVKGFVLTGATKANVEVNVSTIGTYTISTNTVNGIRFSGTGTFGSTGVQTVNLAASGTPVNTGVHVFTITAGSSSCTFSVTVSDATTPPPGTNTDLFPLTINSWRNYIEPGYSLTDTFSYKDVKMVPLGGNSYHLVEVVYDDEPLDTLYYRKSGSNYYEYVNVDYYSMLTFDVEQKADLLFLKEGLSTNNIWYSNTYNGKVMGQSVSLRYEFKCTAANVSATVNGMMFNNVYKISFKPQVKVSGAPSFIDEGLSFEAIYAKGIGLISINDNSNSSELVVTNWKVF